MQIRALQLTTFLAASLLTHCAIGGESTAEDHSSAPSELFMRVYRAFDAGLVKKWGNVSDFDREFSADISRKCAQSQQDDGEWVTFDLEKQSPSRQDDEAANAHGWYVAFNCDRSGVILDYYLSNSRK